MIAAYKVKVVLLLISRKLLEQMNKKMDLSKFKTFRDDKINSTEKCRIMLGG